MERADEKTSEEYVMERLDFARKGIAQVIEDLQSRGPVWDGTHLAGPATSIAQLLSIICEALATTDRIAEIDGADLAVGLSDESELAGWLEVTRQLSLGLCDDPECPDHTVGHTRR